MKIAMIGQKGMPAIHGGVEKHVHDLSTRLVEFGHEITVYSRKWYTQSEDTKFKGVNIKHLPSIHTKHLDAITHTFLATLHAIKNKYDVIHYHGVGPALLAWLPRLFAHRSLVIVTFHSIDRYHQKWNFFAKAILHLGEWAACRFPHQTITVSQSLKKYCLNKYLKETNYIPNGVNLPSQIEADNKIKEFGLNKNQYLVMISRLVPHKGAHVLIQAFTNIKKQSADNEQIKNLKLAIVGGSAYTNNYIKALHKLAGQTNDIIFTDFQSGETLKQLYSHALAMIHPSFNEGLSIAVLEAMAYSRPTLVSNIAEHRELISNNKFIFRKNDVQDLEKKILNFLEMPDREKKNAAQQNKQTIKQFYLWEKIVPQIEEIYQDKKEEIYQDKKTEKIIATKIA